MRKALVIGATGLLGYGVALELNKQGWDVRAVGKENLINGNIFPHEIEYVCGDFYDEAFLTRILKGVDEVFFFLSSTFPTTSMNSLELEISRTLKGLDYLLRKMIDEGVERIVFPSSGGTVYGNVETGTVKETEMLKPTIPYGVGKMMCEDIFHFYASYGISVTILRVGNVYGSSLDRRATQGVIDVFIQKALRGEAVTVWGDALTHVRDYIFFDDFASAVAKIGGLKADGVETYNLSSGVGTSLKEVVEIINKYSDKQIRIKRVSEDATSSIKRIVLNIDKIKNKIAWEPQYDIDSGIREAIKRKKTIL